MTEVALHNVEIIVGALLQVSDSVLEVSRDHVIARIWHADGVGTGRLNEYLGKNIQSISNDDIFTACSSKVTTCFSEGRNEYIEYTTTVNNVKVTYSIRIVVIHPDPNYLFIVLKNLSAQHGERIIEDKWKLAFDAIGDGVWDANMETGRIFFSEKWYEIFGYNPSEIVNSADWSSKIHPDDLIEAQKQMEKYLAGETSSYSAEIRYLCKDGSYKWILSRGVVVSKMPDGKPLRFIGTHTDINERKIAEEKYQANAQLLEELLNSLKDGIIVTDEHNTLIYVNQAFCDIYNIPVPPADIVGTSAAEGIMARKMFFKKPEAFYSKTMEMFRSEKMIIDEEWEMKDGKILTRDYIPVHLSGNKRVGIWKLRDVTEFKNTEKRFERLKTFYEQILNHISADIVVFDNEHRYMFINPVAIKDAELRKWMIGKKDEDYCKYRDRPLSIAERRRAIFNQVKEERQLVEFEEKLQNQSGEIEYHLKRMAPVFNENGDLDIVIGYGLNITDRIKAEEALKTSKDTFAGAFDSSGIGMALISPYGKWLDVNKAISDLTGYSKEELLERNYHDISYADDVDLDRELINKMLQQEITTYTIEKRYVSKKKKIILVQLTLSLVWDADDTPKFFIAQVIDITNKKEMENEIQRKNSELETTRVSLVNKINQLEELSHIIAHNLRGPAGNIDLLVNALIAKNKGGVEEEENLLSNAFTLDEALGFIKDSNNSLMSSLHTLMEITEIKLNKEVPYDDCDIVEFVNGITTQLHSSIYEKHAVIIQNFQVKYVKYPKAYFESILYNFISNALKYSYADVPPEIEISTRYHNDRVQVIVKDNGIGIDLKKYGERLFKLNEVFHQGYDSKGIGLYITKTQIESLGGSIEVRSAPNEGSEFIVTL